MNKGQFARHRNIKTTANQRLIAEGRDGDYRNLVEALKLSGVDESGEMAAWKIALFAFCPVSGGPGEIMADPMFEQIASDWAAGKYPTPPGFVKFPSGMTNFAKLNGEPSAEFKSEVKRIKKAPEDWRDQWRQLSKEVEVDNADHVTEILWAGAHRWTEPGEIDPRTVPSKAALAKLSLIQESTANYAEFLRTFEAKLIPDKRTLEYESRFKDDGRDLQLLTEFQSQEVEQEGSPA